MGFRVDFWRSHHFPAGEPLRLRTPAQEGSLPPYLWWGQ